MFVLFGKKSLRQKANDCVIAQMFALKWKGSQLPAKKLTLKVTELPANSKRKVPIQTVKSKAEAH